MLGATAVRTIGSILIIVAGLVWEFSAEIHTAIGQMTSPGFQAWLASHISQFGPWILIAGGIFWIAFSQIWASLRRWLGRGGLAIVYEPRADTALRRGRRREDRGGGTNRTTAGRVCSTVGTSRQT